MPERNDEAWPRTLEDAAERIIAILSDEARALVAATPAKDLIRFLRVAGSMRRVRRSGVRAVPRRVGAGTGGTDDEVMLLAKVSAGRLGDLVARRVTPHEAFRTAEGGHVLRVTPDAGSAVAVPCCELADEELPPRGEPLAGPRPAWDDRNLGPQNPSVKVPAPPS